MLTPQEKAEELAEMFELFDEWEDRYRFLIDLGRKLPPMNPADKIEANKVHGCQSQVWVVAHAHDEDGQPVVTFDADSDAFITKGLIALLHEIYSGQPAEQILGFDATSFFGRLGLDQHLSPGRRNGLAGMVQRIRALAAELAPVAV